jgi:hypothetical protein
MASSEAGRVTVERIDYATAMRFTKLFNCFRMAVHPSRLLLGLLLIIALYITGIVMDTVWTGAVPANEFDNYMTMPRAEFNRWVASPMARDAHVKYGIFQTARDLEIRNFEGLVQSVLQLRPGLDQLTTAPRLVDGPTVIGSLRNLAFVPLWLWNAHTGFFLVYVTIATVLWSLLGGAISRQAVVEAANERLVPASEAIGYSSRRWGWYIMAPMLAPAAIVVMALLLSVVGLLFYVPVLNILAALLYVAALGLGFVMALLLVGWLAGMNLIYPAISAEGTDGFDAMSRAFSYVFARPWRFIGYSVVALIYGALTYMLVGIFVYLTIALAQWATGMWVSGFDEVLPQPTFGRLSYTLGQLTGTRAAAGNVILVWVHLVIGLLGAYAISYYFSAYSVIYLLLRKYTDGTDTTEVHEPQLPARVVAAEKVEPVTAVSATTTTAVVTETPPQ